MIRSGEAPGVGWSRSMLYSGFISLPRSIVRRQTGFAARISTTLSGSRDKLKFSIKHLLGITALVALQASSEIIFVFLFAVSSFGVLLGMAILALFKDTPNNIAAESASWQKSLESFVSWLMFNLLCIQPILAIFLYKYLLW